MIGLFLLVQILSVTRAVDVRVGMPVGSSSGNPDFYPNWFRDNQTGELKGFFLEYLDEVLKEANLTYTIVQDTFGSYTGLGKEINLKFLINI